VDESTSKSSLTILYSLRKKVDKYQYSSNVFSLPHYLRNISGVVTYQCSCHHEELLAPNLCNTGACCPDCGHFMNFLPNIVGFAQENYGIRRAQR